MRVSVIDTAVLVWLSSEEAQRSNILEEARALAAQNATSPKQKLVAMISGKADYIENTQLLLRNNIT